MLDLRFSPMADIKTHAWIECDSIIYSIRRHAAVQVGRAINSDLRLFEDVGVSREHCRITSTVGRLEVVDLGSPNGTRVNGRAISGTVELGHGDVIKVGDSELTMLFRLNPTQSRSIRDTRLSYEGA